MRNRYKLTFEYDGTRFNGWQKQPEGRTVEGVLEEAFSTLYQEEIDIIGQGRTDAGVHAENQVAHADLPSTFTIDRLHRAMLGMLPKDVALLRVEEVNNEFHARFNAITRTYRYQLLQKPSPLRRKFAWTYFQPISFEILTECSERIVGEHDFSNFCIPPDDDDHSTVCTIAKSEWSKEGKLLTYRIEANRFLRHMVRRLVGTMIHVAEGKISLEFFDKLLSAEKTDRKGHSASAIGLFLESVRY